MQGMAVSAGSACEAGAVEPSHVLQAMGIDDAWSKGSIRISFGMGNNIEQIKAAVTAIKQTADDITSKEKICE
jgi:cysteine desulfurase